MKKTFLLLVVVFLAASNVLAQPARRKALILFAERARHIDRVVSLRARIAELGGRTRAVFGLAGIVAELEPGVAAQLARAEGVRAVYDAVITAPPVGDAQTLAAVEAWNRILTDKPVAKRPRGEPPRGGPPTDVTDAPDFPRDAAERAANDAAYRSHWAELRRTLPPQLQRANNIGCGSNGAGYNDTSLYFAGEIAVGVVYVNGTINNNPAGWSQSGSPTTASTVQTFADVATALDRFLDLQPNGRIAFTYVNEVDGSGNPLPGPANQRTYVNDLRNTYCTDWGFLIQMKNGGVWPNAALFGPALWMDRTFGSFHEVLDHEVGHMFGLGDAYAPASPAPRWGYQLGAHGNACGVGGGFFAGAGECLDDLMAGWGPNFGYNTIIGAWTADQFGWHTTAGDGIPDVLRTKPLIDATSVVHSVNPSTFAVTVNGVASDRPVLSEHPSLGNVSINRIARVEYRIDNAPWQDAVATDGFFDSTSEAFKFTTTPLRSTPLTLQIRATNMVGAVTPIPYAKPLTLTGSTVTNTRPFGSLAVKPERAKVGTVITATGASSRDLEAGTLAYSFKWDNSPWTAFTSTATSTHVFNVSGTYNVQMRVRDAGGLIHLVPRTVVAETFDTAPVIAFAISPPTRHFSTGANYSITMGVSGSTDSETPFAQLKVQWDIDCDGWEGPPSLTKSKTATFINSHFQRSDRRCIRAQVLDTANNTAVAERFSVVVPYNHPPVISGMTFTPSGPNFTVTVAATDPDSATTWDGILEYRFDFEGDGIWDTPFGPSPTAPVLAANIGTLIVEVSDRFFARAIRQACFPLTC